MERDDILECVVIRRDEDGEIYVQYGDQIGLVGGIPREGLWKAFDVPILGDRVKVSYRYATGDDGTIGYDFVRQLHSCISRKTSDQLGR